jgi:hypothetical protein
MPILTKPQHRHTLSHANLELHLLAIPVEHRKEGFAALLGDDLLGVGVVLRRQEMLDCVVLVHDCCCFGVEHEDLSMLLSGYYESLLAGQYHGFINFDYYYCWQSLISKVSVSAYHKSHEILPPLDLLQRFLNDDLRLLLLLLYDRSRHDRSTLSLLPLWRTLVLLLVGPLLLLRLRLALLLLSLLADPILLLLLDDVWSLLFGHSQHQQLVFYLFLDIFQQFKG